MLENLVTVNKITSSIIRYLEKDKNYQLADLLRTAKPLSRVIAYDNWNGGTDIYAFIYEIEIDDYRKNLSLIKSYEQELQAIADLFLHDLENEQLGEVIIRPICRQFINWNLGVSKEDFINRIERAKSIMIAVATSGARIQEMNPEYQELCAELNDEFVILGLINPNEFKDLWDWYNRWQESDLAHYNERRKFIKDMCRETEELIEQSADTILSEEYVPTGWDRVDRAIYEMKNRLSVAITEEQFQAIGMLGREVLITTARQVFNPLVHIDEDSVAPSETDSKRMLEAFISYELKGENNERLRKFAKASIDFANHLTHNRSAQKSDAEICLMAVTAVVNIMKIIAEKH